MAKLGTVTLETELDLKGLDQGLNQGKQKSESSFKKMGVNAKDLFAGAAAAAAVMAANAIKDFAMESLNEFQAFEQGAAEVFTLLPGITEDAMGKMQDDVLAFSREAGRTTDETLGALYQAISAGVSQDNVFEFLEVASDAARGGVTDLETAVDGITSVVNAYGEEVIDAASASDVMFTAVKLGKTNFEQLSGSLFNVIPTAASLGVKFEDVAANLAALTAQGTPTSVATTQLRQAFVEASKSGTSLDMALKRMLGGSFSQLIEDGLTSQEIFMRLRGSMPEQEFRDLFGSVEAANAVLGITSDTAQTIIEDFGTLEDTIGATTDAADVMAQTMETLEGKVVASDEALKIQTGQTLSPLKRGWLELRIGVNEYFAEDLARRNQIMATSKALEDQGIEANRLTNFVNTLGEGNAMWRDSMVDAETMARRTEIAMQLLSEGHEQNADALLESVLAIEEQESALGTTSTVSHRYAQSQEEATEAVEELTDAIEENVEVTASGLTVQQIEEQQRGRLIDLYASQTAAQNDERDAVQEAGDSQERLNEILAERAAKEAELEAATLAAAAAERARNEMLGGFFDTSLHATEAAASLERQLYDQAVAAGAGATELAILAAATGEFTEAEIEAAFQAALMQEQIKMLAEQVANGSMTADEAVDALARLQGQQETTGETAVTLASGAETAAGSLSTLGSNAETAAGQLNSIPTNIDVAINVSQNGSVSLPGSGNGVALSAFNKGGYTGSGSPDQVAGLVHAEEFVFSAPAVQSLGLPLLEALHSMAKNNGLTQTFHVDARGNNNGNDIARTLGDSQERWAQRMGLV